MAAGNSRDGPTGGIVASARPVRASRCLADQEKDGAARASTPTDCWNAYPKEAIAAYIEYEECMKDLTLVGHPRRDAAAPSVYDMRAIGAFSWWMKCVALN